MTLCLACVPTTSPLRSEPSEAPSSCATHNTNTSTPQLGGDRGKQPRSGNPQCDPTLESSYYSHGRFAAQSEGGNRTLAPCVWRKGDPLGSIQFVQDVRRRHELNSCGFRLGFTLEFLNQILLALVHELQSARSRCVGTPGWGSSMPGEGAGAKSGGGRLAFHCCIMSLRRVLSFLNISYAPEIGGRIGYRQISVPA